MRFSRQPVAAARQRAAQDGPAWRRGFRSSNGSVGQHPAERGVALIVTVIMLSVIAFMAIAFLVLSQREKGSVTTTTDQTIATLAAENALESAQAELVATMLAFTNQYGNDLRVSTNYVNSFGFDADQLSQMPGGDGGQLDPSRRSWQTNVSFTYPDGTPVVPGSEDFVQVVANLFYNPRPPVVITNRARANSGDFRFYLDLNRNGRYETNGFIPVVSPNGNFYSLADGREIPPRWQDATNAIRQSFVGDPEWIGVLERPDQPHSSTNRFVSRYAWIALPASKTLDLNAVHNQTKMLNPQSDGFLRNMGVSSFELNLAGFLADLNTNLWNLGTKTGYEPTPADYPPSVAYLYRTNLNQQSQGAAFLDATALTRFRYNQTYNNLRSVNTLFGQTIGGTAFQMDGIDGYANGPFLASTTFPDPATDNDGARTRFAWPGSETPNHYYTPQDFFDATKTSLDFSNRLASAGSKTNSYDRYTFYRMLSQLGTDSDPEPPGKMNLNYDNLVQKNPVTGVVSATNFYPWTATAFFTNAADRLLKQATATWLQTNRGWFMATYATNAPFGISRIPVKVGTNFVYTSGTHRMLQLAANIWEATTNRVDNGLAFPTVFQPILRKDGMDVYITGYFEVDRNPRFNRPVDLRDTNSIAAIPDIGTPFTSQATEVNAYGVPWVIGVRKGLPNFNEFAFQSVLQVTRKLQITRRSLTADVSTYQTNQMYILGISNTLAAEVWNSYRSNYTRPVDIMVANYLSLVLTNSEGKKWQLPQDPFFVSGSTNLATWGGGRFVVPLYTNINFPLPSIYRHATKELSTNLSLPFERGVGFPLPQWGVAATNRLQLIMRDRATGRILDYVQLSGLDNVRDINGEMMLMVDADRAPGFNSLWDTNRVGNSTSISAPQYGLLWQTQIALGQIDPRNTVDWRNYGYQPAGQTKQWAIDNFRGFFKLGPLYFQNIEDNTNLVQEVPFSPSLRLSRYCTWQANDPLVHYTQADMRYYASTNELRRESLTDVPVPVLENIAKVNNRYDPWGGKSTADPGQNPYNTAVKDPLVRSSDDWDFPTNKLPNIGWLGRVHRGTPWQTVYLKSATVNDLDWRRWSGNFDYVDAAAIAPVSDRLIFDLFTTAFSDTSSRGQLSVNQSGLAAWSAVFSGVLGVTNAMKDSDVRTLALWGGSPTYRPQLVEPNSSYTPTTANPLSPLAAIVNDINLARATNRSGLGVFTNLGDVLSAPALTDRSPFLNQSSSVQREKGLTDAAYERLPQQVLGLLKVGEPRFVIYGYGQTLRPAVNSVIASGPFAGVCTNYQIAAETAIRAVVRVEGAPDKPRTVVESYNPLPPD